VQENSASLSRSNGESKCRPVSRTSTASRTRHQVGVLWTRCQRPLDGGRRFAL